jgi:Protein of unknown function (DUF1566)
MKVELSIPACAAALGLLIGCGCTANSPQEFSNRRTMETVDGLDILEPGDVVIDPSTGLVWQRCSLGERWNGAVCEGFPESVTLDEAEASKPPGWRIPDIRELATLVRCSSTGRRERVDIGDGLPPIESTCGGNRPSVAIHRAFLTKDYDLSHGLGYWSGSRDKRNDAYHHMIYFKLGQLNGLPSTGSDSKVHVRYVRDAK